MRARINNLLVRFAGALSMLIRKVVGAMRWLPLPALVIVAFPTLILWQTLKLEQRRQIESTTVNDAHATQLAVKLRLRDRLRAISRMSQRWALVDHPDQKLWEADADAFVHDYPEISALGWVDADHTVRWVVPLTGNERVVGIDLAFEPSRRQALATVEETGQFTFSRTVNLIHGGQGIIGIAPMTSEHGLRGFTTCVVEIDDFFEIIRSSELDERYDLVVTDNGQGVYASVAPDESSSTITAECDVRFRGMNWRLRLTPTAATLALNRTYAPEAVLAAGLTIAALFAFAVHCWQQARQRSLAAERAAAALRESEQRFEAAVQGSSDGVFDHSFATSRIFYSPRAKQLMGFTPDAAIDDVEAWKDRIHPDDRDRVWQSAVNHVEQKTPYDQEYRFEVRPGEYRWLHSRGQAVWSENGVPLRMAGTISDITDRKRVDDEIGRRTEALTETNRLLHESSLQIEQQAVTLQFQAAELERAKSEAERANVAKSLFIANMSHEIRTPMTAILGFVDLLLDELAETGERRVSQWRQPLQTIKRNGEHLLTIINDILDLSKIESNHLEIELLPCNVAELVTDVISLMENRAKTKGLELSVQYSVDAPAMITTDPTRLRQILLNVVSNAIKFTQAGRVHVQVGIAVENDTSLLTLDVTDTGVGITPEQAARMFQPFVQADNTTARMFGGTGLGLTISRRLAKMLGGEIGYESTSGEGSVFHITVATGPIVSQSRGACWPPAVAPINASLLHGRILLAEDGLDNQRLITLLLKKAGAEVVLAENGEQAIEMARAAWRQQPISDGLMIPPIDLILMDMQMPVIDGLTATSRLRAEGYTLPIVALTANVMQEDRARCLAAGCNDFATKPIDRESFFATLARWLPAKTAITTNPSVMT